MWNHVKEHYTACALRGPSEQDLAPYFISSDKSRSDIASCNMKEILKYILRTFDGHSDTVGISFSTLTVRCPARDISRASIRASILPEAIVVFVSEKWCPEYARIHMYT